MRELEEENSSLRSELGAELAKLAEIDPDTQERMLSVTQRMGAGLLDPELLAKYARKQDLSLPLFQHAAKVAELRTAGAPASGDNQPGGTGPPSDNLKAQQPPTAVDLAQMPAASSIGAHVKQEHGAGDQLTHLGESESSAWAQADLGLNSTNVGALPAAGPTSTSAATGQLDKA